MLSTFKCEHCGGTFKKDQKDWDDAAQQAEYEQNFSLEEREGQETRVVCDDCYRMMMLAKRRREPNHKQGKP
jgi:Fe2+ or Zn2+ uptake regulation protein